MTGKSTNAAVANKHKAKQNGIHMNGTSSDSDSDKPLAMLLLPFTYFYIIIMYILGFFIYLVKLPSQIAATVYYDLFLGQVLLYNVSFEDARIDRAVLNVRGKVVLTLTSAGDNVLDALTEDASRVIAIDQNVAQTALFELKVAAIKTLTYDQFWAIFGDCQGDVFRAVYFEKLRPLLTEASAKFWDKRQNFIDNLYYNGGSGWAGWFLMTIFIPVMGLRGFIQQIMASPNLEAQKKVYAQWRPYFLNIMRVLYYCGAWKWISWLVAVPTNQQSLLSTNWEHYMEHVLDHICQKTHLSGENHYYSIYIDGKYKKHNCPRYLQEKYFDMLKTRMDRIDIRCANLFNVMKELANQGQKVDRFNLLDHMDWMDEQAVLTEWQYISACASPDALAIWKSISEIASPNVLSFLPTVPSAEPVINDFLANKDFTPTYRSIRCVQIPTDYVFIPRIVPDTGVQTFRNDMSVLFAMYLLPILRKLKLVSNSNQAKPSVQGEMTASRSAMNTFYEPQAALYDSYRHRMLHGRPLLAACMPIKKGSVWIDVGGGTGFNLEYIGNCINNFKKVYVVDVCDPLLEQANKRIASRGWKNVTTIRRDVCSKEGILTTAEESGGVDLMTFSYSLTMIPDWRSALENAKKLLKPGGMIAIADFTVLPSGFQADWSRLFFTKVFSVDGVNLSTEHRRTLVQMFAPVVNEVRFGGFPYVPSLFSCPYYVYVGVRLPDGADFDLNSTLSPTAREHHTLRKRASGLMLAQATL